QSPTQAPPLPYPTLFLSYRRAGPPPLLLRLLGPLVVLTSLAVLGTGLALIAHGSKEGGRLGSFAGFRLGALTLHKAAFVLWLVRLEEYTMNSSRDKLSYG